MRGWYKDYSPPDWSEISPSYPCLRISILLVNAAGIWIQLTSCVILDSLSDWSQKVSCQCHNFCNCLSATCYVLEIVFVPHSHFGYISSYIVQQWGQKNSMGLVFAFTKPEWDGQLLLVHFQHLSSVLLGSLLNPFTCRRWSTLHRQKALYSASMVAVLCQLYFFS